MSSSPPSPSIARSTAVSLIRACSGSSPYCFKFRASSALYRWIMSTYSTKDGRDWRLHRHLVNIHPRMAYGLKGRMTKGILSLTASPRTSRGKSYALRLLLLTTEGLKNTSIQRVYYRKRHVQVRRECHSPCHLGSPAFRPIRCLRRLPTPSCAFSLECAPSA